MVGESDGTNVGCFAGFNDGWFVGAAVIGPSVGIFVGCSDGAVGEMLGFVVRIVGAWIFDGQSPIHSND